MKKLIQVVLAVSLALTFSSLVLAQEKAKTRENPATQGTMPGKGMTHKDAHKDMMICGAGMMMGKSIAPTMDGGVIVLIGNKLFKYDKNLELKKEVEIKIDVTAMKKMKQKGSRWREKRGIESEEN